MHSSFFYLKICMPLTNQKHENILLPQCKSVDYYIYKTWCKLTGHRVLLTGPFATIAEPLFLMLLVTMASGIELDLHLENNYTHALSSKYLVA